MAENVRNLEKFRKFVSILGHVCTGVQIIVLFMVSLCLLYIACGIFEVHILDFAEPLIDSARAFTTTIFGDTVQSRTPDVDGKVVLFVMVNIIVAFFIAQLKLALSSYGKDVDKRIVDAKNELEKQFNAQLQDKLRQEIMAQSNYIIALQFKLKFLMMEGFGITAPTEEEMDRIKYDVISAFFEQIKTVPGIRFSKDGDILLISSADVKNVDAVIDKIWAIYAEIKAEYKAQKFGVRMKAAIQTHRPTESANTAYKTIRPLLDLNANNEMLCFGNFKNRYELIQNTGYLVAVKGKYDLKASGKEEAVWYLVKKD